MNDADYQRRAGKAGLFLLHPCFRQRPFAFLGAFRQHIANAVTRLAHRCDLVLVVGSPNSSNSNRLKEIAENQGRPAYLIDGPQDIRREWLDGVGSIGLTAGASAPEVLVESVINHLRGWGASDVEQDNGEPETVVFALPRNLLNAIHRQ